MTIQSIDEVYDITSVHDRHIRSFPFDGSGDTEGWVKATIDGFEVDEDDGDLDMVVRLPWGETHRYGFDANSLHSGEFAKVCKSYGVAVSDFDKIVGESVWLKVRYVEIADGDVSSGTRIQYEATKLGPYRRILEYIAVGLVALVVLAIIFIP